jgi:hypothetical protein
LRKNVHLSTTLNRQVGLDGGKRMLRLQERSGVSLQPSQGINVSMLESLPDVFMPATEWEWAVMERCIEITVAPNRVLPAYGARPSLQLGSLRFSCVRSKPDCELTLIALW